MTTKVVFLGGLGEIGRNMLAIENSGQVVVIDAGLSFPTDEMLGVDLVLPDFTYLKGKDVLGVVLTHGHEDHIGALSWFLRDIPAPVFGTPLTLGLASRRPEEFEVDVEANDIGDGVGLGPFTLTPVPVSHSIPDAVAYCIDTPDGRVVYTGDFKIDPTPIDGRSTDMETFRRLGTEGVDLLLSDSTNVENPGRTPSESLVGDALREIFEGARRRIVLACFASNLHRIQQVCDAAAAVKRKVAIVGRSMVHNVEAGRRLGHLDVAEDQLIDVNQLDHFAPHETVVVCTGSQGEPLSALSLIAVGDHKYVHVGEGDTVVLSASPIPGNESAVHRVINGLYRAGAEVYHPPSSKVHVSGHAGRDELAEMLDAVKPRHFTPVHGEFRQLALHARLAEAHGVAEKDIFIVEDGDVLELRDGKLKRGDRVTAGMVFVDGLGVGDVGPIVLRDRRVLAGDGVLICVITIDGHTGEVLAGPDLITRGFVHEDESRDFLDEAADRVAEAIEKIEPEMSTEWSALKKAARRALGEFVWHSTRRRPMILPIIMEV